MHVSISLNSFRLFFFPYLSFQFFSLHFLLLLYSSFNYNILLLFACRSHLFIFTFNFANIHIIRSCTGRPFNSQEALDKAKKAVEENYAVVGVLEDLNTTFAVLEHYVPRFFRGVSGIYHGLYLIDKSNRMSEHSQKKKQT